MSKEYIIYKIEQSPIKFENEIYLMEYKEKINIIIIPNQKGFQVKIEFLPDYSTKNKIQFAQRTIEEILDLLAFKYKEYFSKPKEIDRNISDKQICKGDIYSFITVEEKSINKSKLDNILSSYNNINNLYLNLYRISLSEKNDIASFMFLYNIMLSLFDDNQNKVDKYIKNNFSEINFTQSPFKENKYESVFTKLRNEVAHNRKNSHFKTTKNEVSNNLKKFKEVVKSAIIKNFN